MSGLRDDACDVAGVILAGGRSRRFGSDKMSAHLLGIPLVERVAARARSQVAQLVLSGRAVAGLPAIPDRVPGQGPLSALPDCLSWAMGRGFGFLATFPCDAPFFPLDLVDRLRAGLGNADCVMARRAGRAHFVFGLWRTDRVDKLRTAIDAGARAFRDIDTDVSRRYTEIDDGSGPLNDPFFNINRPADLALAEEWLRDN